MITSWKSAAAILALGSLILVPAVTSHAVIIFTPNNNFGGGSQGNVLVGSAWNNVMHIDANLNGAPPALDGFVQVDSTELISGQGSGQATFDPDDGLMNHISFSLSGGYGFKRFTLNPQAGTGTYSLLVDFLDSSANPFQAIFNPASTLGPGTNRFTLEATAGDLMKKVTFTSATGAIEIKQARILDVFTDPTGGGGGGNPVPEPGTWAMLIGSGVAGLGFVIRGRRSR